MAATIDMANPRTSGRDQQARYDIGALEQRVYGVEKAINDISSSIAALGTKIDERSRTPWATLISAAAFLLLFMSTVGILAYRPIEADIGRHERHLSGIEDRYVADMQRTIDALRHELMARSRSGT